MDIVFFGKMRKLQEVLRILQEQRNFQKESISVTMETTKPCQPASLSHPLMGCALLRRERRHLGAVGRATLDFGTFSAYSEQHE